MAKYHIGLDGMPKVCKAKIKCRFGNIIDHFNTVEDAQVVADDLNQQLASAQGFGIATKGNWTTVDNRTKTAIAQLNNLSITIQRLENIQKQAREEVLKSLQDNNVSSLSVDGVGRLNSIAGGERTTIDTNQLKADGKYDEYSKESTVNEHTRLIQEDSEKVIAFKEKMTTPSGKVIEFSISTNEYGITTIDENTKQALVNLKKYEETLKQTKALEKELKNELMNTMKEQNIDKVVVGTTTMEYVPTHNRLILDSKKLKNNEYLYDKYSKKTQVKPSLRITYSK